MSSAAVFVVGLVVLYAICIYRLYLYSNPRQRPTRTQKKKLVEEVESFLKDGE